MLRLSEALASLESFEGDATIYAAKPWTADSRTVVAGEGDSEAQAAIATGMPYLLEVWIAREVVKVWSAWRDGRVPTVDERCEAVIHYAVHDVYLQAS
jgi:hypothetical protein